jgi:hypothetical protein
MVCAAASGAGAQRAGAVEVRWDNDFLAPRGGGKPQDRDYTQGLEIAVEFGRDTASARGGYRVALGQRIYTPRVDGDEPVPGERPYAGWLYASIARRSGGPRAEYTLAAEAGVTGPPALAEPVQNAVHRLTNSQRQRGWANQLGFEPAFVVRGRAELPRRIGVVEVRPYGEAGVGTLWDGVAAGARAEAGGERGLRGAAAVRGEAVARDLFIDGNTFATRIHAGRRTLVAQAEAAVGYRWRSWAAEYRVTARGREYAAQASPHLYGTVTLRRQR